MSLVDGVGCWLEARGDARFDGRPALFLDRDGVVVEDVEYLCRVEEIRLIPGSAAVIARMNAAGVPVVLATNQSGIGRGYYDWTAFVAVETEIERRLSAEGARFDLVLACAFHDDGIGALRAAGHPWRKPNPGMLREAGERLDLDLKRSWIVGDKGSDLEAGAAAGLRGAVLVETGQGRDPQHVRRAEALRSAGFRVERAADLADAADLLAGELAIPG